MSEPRKKKRPAIVPPEPEVTASEARRLPPWVVRGAVWTVVGIAGLGVATPIALWSSYRASHVVSRNALVKGHIADVGAQLDGVVTRVTVDFGDRVRAGQLMARFEDRQLQAKVQQCESQFEEAGRELEVERLAIAHERRRLASSVAEASARVASAEAQLEAAQSRADDAREILARREALMEEQVIGQAEVNDAETVLRTAEALVAAARAEREASGAAFESAQVESDGLAVREVRTTLLDSKRSAAAAALALAEADLAGTEIRAPDDGWVVRRIVEPGVSVVKGQTLVSLWIGGGVWVEAWFDEDDLSQVAVGSQARVTLKPYPDREFTGTVETIGVSTDFELPEADVPQPRTARMRDTPVFLVRVELDESEEALFPGLSAVVGIRKKRPGFLPSLFARDDRAPSSVAESSER